MKYINLQDNDILQRGDEWSFEIEEQWSGVDNAAGFTVAVMKKKVKIICFGMSVKYRRPVLDEEDRFDPSDYPSL